MQSSYNWRLTSINSNDDSKMSSNEYPDLFGMQKKKVREYPNTFRMIKICWIQMYEASYFDQTRLGANPLSCFEGSETAGMRHSIGPINFSEIKTYIPILNILLRLILWALKKVKSCVLFPLSFGFYLNISL